MLIKGSCAAEGITHGRNGFLIDENADSMAALLEEVSKDLGHLHEVGQNAMDEIYISWEQAVRLAYDRYKEIHEMAVSGELGIRKHQSFEYLMNSAATILNGTQKVFVDIPKEMHDGMKAGYYEFREGMRDNYEELKEDVSVEVEKIRGNINEGLDKLSNNMNEIRDKVSGNLEKIKDNLSDKFD